MCDVLPTINRLSEQFQKAKLEFSLLKVSLQGTLSSLDEKMKGNMTDSVKDLINKLQAANISVKVQGNSVEEDIKNFQQNVGVPFIQQIMTNIESRFKDTDIMASFMVVFSDTTYTNTTPTLMNDTKKAADALCEQFGLPKEQTRNELADFFHYAKAADSVGELLQKLPKHELESVFPNLSTLSLIYKVQPPHTADCERDFSQMGLTKTNIRNRMGEDTLDCLLRIIIEGPSLESFPFERAVRLWAQKKERRYKIQLV
jgi:hypothetical protein